MLGTLLHYLFGCVYFCWENQGDEIHPFVHNWLFLQDAHKVFSNFAKLGLSVNLSVTVLLPYNVLEQAYTGSWEPTGFSFSLSFCLLKPVTLTAFEFTCLFCISLLFCHDIPLFSEFNWRLFVFYLLISSLKLHIFSWGFLSFNEGLCKKCLRGMKNILSETLPRFLFPLWCMFFIYLLLIIFNFSFPFFFSFCCCCCCWSLYGDKSFLRWDWE